MIADNQEDALARPEFKLRQNVLALFPGTTCFYSSIVMSQPSRVNQIYQRVISLCIKTLFPICREKRQETICLNLLMTTFPVDRVMHDMFCLTQLINKIIRIYFITIKYEIITSV